MFCAANEVEYSFLSFSFTSGIACTIVQVDDNPLQVRPDSSTPAANGAIDIGETWTLRFNSEVNMCNAHCAWSCMLNENSLKKKFSLTCKNKF